MKHDIEKTVQSFPKDNEALKRHWERAGTELDRRRRRELRLASDEEALRGIDDLIELALQHGSPRMSSGLTEMRRRLDAFRGRK